MELKTQYKYIHFEESPQIIKVWEVFTNKKDVYLGRISWYGIWRCYCFEPNDGTIYSPYCLADIIDFIKQLEKKK